MAKLCAVLALLAVAAAVEISPVQKVIELLDENKAKVAADLAAEEKEMEAFAAYCDDELTEKGYAIKTATASIAELEADIEEGTTEAASLNEEVAAIGTLMASKEKQLDDAEAERGAAKTTFEKNEAELVQSIDELERAVAVMKNDVSFVQQAKKVASPQRSDVKKVMKVVAKVLSASWVNSKDFKALKGFVQTKTDTGDDLTLRGVDAPEAAAFEAKTGGIVGQLEEMKEKAEEQLSDARSSEMKDKHTFDMMAQSLTDAIKVAKEKLSATKSAIETTEEEAGKAQAQLADTEKAKAADEKYVQSLTQECASTKEEWAERQSEAKEEMAVIEKAKSILSERVQVGFVQVHKKGDADAAEPSPKEQRTREKVVAKLQQMSRKFHSYALMSVVSAAAADPFEKIKGLIEEMVAKLTAEANAEATQKGFCDEEKAKSTEAKTDKSMTIDKLTARLDKAKSTKAELEQQVKELEAQVAALDKGEAEATAIRNEEHTTYLKSSKDFKDAAEAVSEAIVVLKEYYEGAMLVQVGVVRSAKAPKFGSAKGDSASVILSILEMSAEDFEKMHMKVESEEREAVSAYNKLLIENKVSKTSMQAEIKGSLSEIKSLDVAIMNSKEDYDYTSKELEAVMAYLEKLKPQCETQALSYGEKKARREQEIEGLKEALSILESETALVQTGRRLRHA